METGFPISLPYNVASRVARSPAVHAARYAEWDISGQTAESNTITGAIATPTCRHTYGLGFVAPAVIWRAR